MSKGWDQAVATLKGSLLSKFGSNLADIVEAEVNARISGKNKLDREDLDAIEHSILSAKKLRRGGTETLSTRRTKSTSELCTPKPPPVQLSSPTAPIAETRQRLSTASSRASHISATARDMLPRSTSEPTLKSLKPPPFATVILDIDDNESDRSRVKVVPKFPVPLRPKLKPMDHWDLMVAYDTMRHRKEDEHFRKAGKSESHAKFKKRLDDQMEEINAIRANEEAGRRREQEETRQQAEENCRLTEAEQKVIHDKRDEMKRINDECMAGLELRRKREEDRMKREQDLMQNWLSNERAQQLAQKQADAIEHARKCKEAKDEMMEAIREAERKKKAKQEEEKAEVKAAKAAMDDAEASGRAAVKARMDKIERNCATLGAVIAERDARMEAELQASIKRVQEEADRAAKEDAEKRRNDRNRKVRDMLDTLGKQCKQREEDGRRDIEENKRQAAIFKEEYEKGLTMDQAKAEKARKARADMDVKLIEHIRRNQSVHPRDFGADLTKQQELAYNRGLIEQIAADGFALHITSKLLPQVNHTGTGKTDPFPSVGRYGNDISSLEMQHPDVG